MILLKLIAEQVFYPNIRDAETTGCHEGQNTLVSVVVTEYELQAAWCLQVFATVFYVAFSVVVYVYIGNTVQSPALFSLPPAWAKATFGIALVNFLLSVIFL